MYDFEQQVMTRLDAIERYCLLAAKNVFNLDDVAAITGLSRSHIYKLTCSHQIPHYKPNGKQIYFDRAEIERWMKKNRVLTNDEAEQIALDLEIRKKGGRK